MTGMGSRAGRNVRLDGRPFVSQPLVHRGERVRSGPALDLIVEVKQFESEQVEPLLELAGAKQERFEGGRFPITFQGAWIFAVPSRSDSRGIP